MDDYTNYGMSARFKAAAMGIEFIPVRDHGGSSMELTNRGKMIKSPFSGKHTYLVPACYPDLGSYPCNRRGQVRQLPDFRRALHLPGNRHGIRPYHRHRRADNLQ